MSESYTLGSCWTCNNAASMDACKLSGSYKQCDTLDDRCELEIRKHGSTTTFSTGCTSNAVSIQSSDLSFVLIRVAKQQKSKTLVAQHFGCPNVDLKTTAFGGHASL